MTWSCSIPMTSYTIVVTPLIGAGSELANNEVSLSLGNNTFGDYYAFGTQPPILNQDQVLNLVTDSQEPSKGPAWFFEMPYNKIVAQPGDRPWFCYWNGTLLEAFIYVNLTSSAGRSASTSPASAAASITSSYGSSVPSATPTPSSGSSGSSQQFKFPPAYPNVLKIEERRVPGPQEIPPYCVQHIIDDYGAAAVATNSTGQPVIVYLNETDSSIISEMESKRSYHDQESGLSTRDLDSVACGCVWLWT